MTIDTGAPGNTPRARAEGRAGVDAFGCSGDGGTEAVGIDGTVEPAIVADWAVRTMRLVDEPIEQRAEWRTEARVWELSAVRDFSGVLGRSPEGNPADRIEPGCAGRRHHRGPEVDDDCLVTDPGEVGVGEALFCRVIDECADLVVRSEDDLPEQDRFGERP